MPLMVDPWSGSSLYGQQASIFSYGNSMDSTSLATATATIVTAVTASALPTSDPHGLNMTEVLKDEAAQQAGLDNTTPRNLLLAFATILLFCMLISHPRFLARFFASIPCVDPQCSKRRPSVYLSDMADRVAFGQERVQRVVGGGSLAEGWLLRKGERRPTMGSPIGEESDPFAPSPGNLSYLTPTAPGPHLLPPPHISPVLSHLPFSSSQLWAPFSRFRKPFMSSASLVQLGIIASYLSIIAVALTWKTDISGTTKSKGYGYDFGRSGMVALTHVPVVVALGVRGNLIGLCVGKGYERLKIFHKVVGRVLFLAATLHVVFFIHKWAMAGIFFTYTSKRFVAYGFVAWGSLILVILSSMPWVRKAWYGLFEICHFVGMVGLLVGLCVHADVAEPFCIAALLIYVLSIIASLTKTRVAHAELTALPGASTTLITIPALRSGWRAGQHVRLRVPALGLPFGAESHPFTIASAPNGEGLLLMCKAAGDWTKKLHELAKQNASQMRENFTSSTLSVTVILEGPYGGIGNTLLPSFSAVVLIAGGSGITHALALATDLITRAPTGVVRARTVDLVWIVRTQDVAKPFIPPLLELVDSARACEAKLLATQRTGISSIQPTALRISIYVTRCPASSPLNLLTLSDPFRDDQDDILVDRPNLSGFRRFASEADEEKYAYLCRNPSSRSTCSSSSLKGNSLLSTISAHACKPNFGTVLTNIMEETISRHARYMMDASGLCVTTCGPVGMCHDVRETVRGLEGWKKRGVGGVELEQETFGF